MNLRRPDGSHEALRLIARQMRDRFIAARAFADDWAVDDWRAAEWQILGTELASQLTLIKDRRLRAAATELHDAWTAAIASAPPRLVGIIEERLIWSFVETDHQRALRELQHSRWAREGLDAARVVIADADALEGHTTAPRR